MTPLVTTAWLADNLGAPDLCVFDASFYMPAEKIDPQAVFAEGHVPGARFFDIETIADVETALPHMVPSAGRFERLMQALGVWRNSRVVFYDQKGIFSAPRGWWMMRLFGHDQVAVLDGGLPKWRAEGRAIEAGAQGDAVAGDFRGGFSGPRGCGVLATCWRISKANASWCWMRGRRGGLRGRRRSRGRGCRERGSIPGAHSVPASELLGPGQVFLPPDALRARFAEAGVGADTRVVTSCGTGVSAAVLSLGLELAGLPSGALYDGSWTEWAGRGDTPKEMS